MMKKIVSIALAMVCASNLVLASISNDEASAAMLAGKAHAEKMLKEGRVEELNAELDDAANGLSTLSLENSQKALWFCVGVATVFAGYGLWKFGCWGWNKIKAKKADTPASTPAPANPQTPANPPAPTPTPAA
jgi:hypothetical protein